MKTDMLGKLVLALVKVPSEMLGTLVDLAIKLAGEQGQETWTLLKRLLRGEVKVVFEAIIELLGTIKTSATKKKFVAKDKFKLKKDGGICSGFGDNFKSWYLDGDGKVENPLGEQTLRFGKLTKRSVDGPIIKEMGGEAKAETTLTEMFDLMSKQPTGKEDGPLLTNGWVNIFYVRDINGVLRAVDVRWYVGGWYVNASSVVRPGEWYDGLQVFSRNS